MKPHSTCATAWIKSLVEVENRTLFFDLWFKELPEPSAQRLISAAAI